MKKSLFTILLLLSFTPFGLKGQEQEYPKVDVRVSSDKIRRGSQFFYSHVVEEKQTLYSISKAYGVSTVDIIEANPRLDLNNKPLQAGKILLIPILNKIENTSLPEEIEGIEQPDSLEKSLHIVDSLSFKEKEVSLSLLLPFAADSSAKRNYLNFYFGSLLAVRDMAMQGLNLDVKALDITKESEFEAIREALGESDVIIGPVSSADIKKVYRLLPDNKYIVSPLDTRTESLTKNGRIILASTPAKTQIEDVTIWLKEDMEGGTDSLIVVRETNYKITPTEILMLQALDLPSIERLVEIDYALSNGLEMNEWFNSHTHLGDTLTRVVAASEHDIFVKDVIRNVYLQNNLKKNTIIYGPAKTRSEEMEEMCDARLHSSVSFHINYDDPEVIRFIKDYRALYQCEPDSFAFHGYDTTRYFISLYAYFGEEFLDHIQSYTYSGLQTYFRFERPDGWEGAVNAGLRRLVYSPGFKLEICDK